MKLTKVFALTTLTLAVHFSAYGADAQSVPCAFTQIEVDGVKHTVTDSSYTICKEDAAGTLVNTLNNPKHIYENLWNAFSSDGGFRIGNSTNVADTLVAVQDAIFYLAAIIAGVAAFSFVGLFFFVNREREDKDKKYLWQAFGAAAAFILAATATNTNLNYLANRYLIASASKAAGSIDQARELDQIKKTVFEFFNSLEAVGNSNNLTAIAMQDVVTTNYIDAQAYQSFSKDYSDGSFLSIIQHDLSYKDFLNRINACNVIKPNYILSTNTNWSLSELDVGWVKKNTSIKFGHVNECSDDAYLYRPEVYGYTYGKLGEITFPTLDLESKYFSTENYKDKVTAIKRYVDQKSNYSPQFANNAFNAFRNSPVKAAILEKINKGVSIDIGSLRNVAIMDEIFSKCASTTDAELASLSKDLNKSKSEIRYETLLECRDAFFGKNKNGIDSTTELYKSALTQAKNIYKQYCGIKEAGDRIAAKVNSNSYVPFTDAEKTQIEPQCFSFDKEGLKYLSTLTPRDIVEADKTVMLENNLVASYFDHVNAAFAKGFYDWYMANETNLPPEDKKKYGPMMRFPLLLISTSSNASDLYDATGEVSPSINSTIPWYETSNFLNWNVLAEEDNISQEKFDSVTLPKIRLDKHLNNGNATASGNETSLSNFKNDKEEIDINIIIKMLDELLNMPRTTSSNLMKGMNGSENIQKKLPECSIIKNTICYNGGNTFASVFKGTTEGLSNSVKFFLGFYAISKAGDLINNVADSAADMSGGAIGPFMKFATKLGGSILTFVSAVSAMIAEVFSWIILAYVLLAGMILWVIAESVLLFVNAIIWNSFLAIRLFVATLVGAFKGTKFGLEYWIRSFFFITYTGAFCGVFADLFMSIFSIVDAYMWAGLCDIFLMVKAKMNSLLGLLFGQTIHILMPLQTCISIVVTMKLIKGTDSTIRHLIHPSEADNTHHDSLSPATAIAGGSYLQRQANQTKVRLQNQINMISKPRK